MRGAGRAGRESVGMRKVDYHPKTHPEPTTPPRKQVLTRAGTGEIAHIVIHHSNLPSHLSPHSATAAWKFAASKPSSGLSMRPALSIWLSAASQ